MSKKKRRRKRRDDSDLLTMESLDSESDVSPHEGATWSEPEPHAPSPAPEVEEPQPAEPDAKRTHPLKLEIIESPAPHPRLRYGELFWGLALGFLVTLTVVVMADRGWLRLPDWRSATPHSSGDQAGHGDNASRSIYLTGMLPPGGRVYVDGQAVDARDEEGGVRVSLRDAAKKLEVRGASGPWWSTRIPGVASPDTLRPLLMGDVVVEVERHGPTGMVHLDGVEAGTAPGSVGDVGPGWHLVTIRDGSEILYETSCVVTPGEVTVVTVPPLPPRGKGRLIIEARTLTEEGYRESRGNPVLIDGRPRGETPVEVTLSAGFHSVRVQGIDHPPLVEILHLEAGRSRYVNAEFGREDVLAVTVAPPVQARGKTPLAVPVKVEWEGQGVVLSQAQLNVIREGQSRPIPIPMVHSETDDKLWVAVLPAELLPAEGVLRGYATCTDDVGRTGTSDLFQLSLR